jgi:hypothetical protein
MAMCKGPQHRTFKNEESTLAELTLRDLKLKNGNTHLGINDESSVLALNEYGNNGLPC